MTGSFPLRPDGLVDGTRIPHNALTDTGCTHEHASRVVPRRAGQVDVWHCRDCDERWKVAAVTFPAGQTVTIPRQVVDAALDAEREFELRRHRYRVVPDTDTTTGPSGLLARFRQRRTRKA